MDSSTTLTDATPRDIQNDGYKKPFQIFFKTEKFQIFFERMMRSYPLSSVRVLEFEGIGPGPLGACMLADFGADVASALQHLQAIVASIG